MKTSTPSYRGHRFPAEIIAHSVWLYHRFGLSFRDVEDLLAERGIIVTHETVRQGCRCVVGHGWHHLSVCGTVALQLVGHETPRRASLASQEFEKEPLRRTPIAATLNEDIDHIAVLVDSAPKVVPLALDSREQLIQVPSVAKAALSFAETARVLRAELPAPLPNRFVGDDDPALGEEVLDIPETQSEAMVEPDSVADDFSRESVSAVTRCGRAHRSSLAATPPS